jgi:hypothetical protein
MSKKRNLPEENYKKLLAFRNDLFENVLSGKASSEDFANGCFQFLIQNKIRPVAKAHDLHSVLINYYYWLIQIERRLANERRLIEYGVGSEMKFRELTEVYCKRRDQMVRRLVWELKLPVKEAYIVFRDTVEVILASGEILYSSKESLDKVKFEVEQMGKSKIPMYLPILEITIKF